MDKNNENYIAGTIVEIDDAPFEEDQQDDCFLRGCLQVLCNNTTSRSEPRQERNIPLANQSNTNMMRPNSLLLKQTLNRPASIAGLPRMSVYGSGQDW